jgi:hypothetical protein
MKTTTRRTLLLMAFGCTAGLTGLLFVAKVGVFLALMAYYRPALADAYDDVAASQHIRTLGILRALDAWITYLLVIELSATGLLGGAVLVLCRRWKRALNIEIDRDEIEAAIRVNKETD